MKRDRAVIYKDFYTNKFSAVKAVIVVYLDAAFEDFFIQYPFNSKNFKDYDHDKMRNEIEQCARAVLDNIKFTDVN